KALGIHKVSFLSVIGLVPIAIFAGLIPIAIMGIGVRDTAFILLFQSMGTKEQIILIGIFATARYLVVGALGIPFISKYISKIIVHKKV
ncbi:MAG: hypothetical protein HQK51_20045, partial [Oligoflexia bacterium]|nr:hypothetical protein [Oligoflexia bacterium]